MRMTLAMAAIVLAAPNLLAQGMMAATTGSPRISTVYPAGAQAGSTATVSVVGQDLSGVEGLHFSLPGVKSELLGTETPSEMKKGGGGMAGAASRTSTLKFRVDIPANAPVGLHDLRVVCKNGISNPRAFLIGDRPESIEAEPNDDVSAANKIPLDTTVNGVIDKAVDVDYYQFTGKKGQRIVASCLTSGIESRLHAVVDLISPSGRQLANNRNYLNNDAVADVILPEDGDYLVRIASFTYSQGGTDYHYRLTVGQAPWIDSVLPAAVEPGKETKVEILGRNLPGGVAVPGLGLEKATLTVKAPGGDRALQRLDSSSLVYPAASALDGFDLRLPSPHGVSNPYFIALAKSPVAVETEPNDSADSATQVTVPAQVSGRIGKRGDVDWFRFDAKKGEPLAIELFADRLNPSPLGSSVDLRFVVVGPKGNTMTTIDESTDVMANQFYVRNDDPARYRIVPTADGEYRVGVSSSDGSFGPRSVYSLRIAPEDGDFRVVAMPASPIAPDGTTVAGQGRNVWNVFVWRLGDFVGDVTVTGVKLPPGVSVKPQVISSTQKQAAILVEVSDSASYTGPIELEATATINGKTVARQVRAATITYPTAQAGTPLLSRLDRELVLATRGQAKYELIPSKTAISVVQGDKIDLGVAVKAVQPEFKTPVNVSAILLPTGLTLAPTNLTFDKESPLAFDTKSTVLPGNYTLVLRGQTQPAGKQPPPKDAPPNIVEYSPPISLTIIPKQLVKLAPPGDTVKIGRGKETTATVSMTRLFPFAGPITIETTSGKGVNVVPLKLKGDETEWKLTIRADEDAVIGPTTLIVRATARFNDLSIPHELKLPVQVTK